MKGTLHKSLCALALALLFSGSALAAGGPDVINLKEAFQVEGKKKAVLFPHHQHQAKLSCDACHQSAAGGDSLKVTFDKKSGFSNDFHKKFCWPCHVEKKVPKGKSCTTCHTGP